jgi:phosphoribosylformylglycinamidine cyclo-ligase
MPQLRAAIEKKQLRRGYQRMNEDRLDYKSAGVDIATGDEASRIMFAAALETWPNRHGKLGEIRTMDQHFRSVRYFHGAAAVEDVVFGMNADGIGTKIELAERLQAYATLGSDLLAMICDDAAITGAEPLHVTTVLDMARVDLAIVKELALGLVQAASQAGVAVLNGETAELQGRVGGFGSSPFNWSGTCFWAARLSTLRIATKVQPGDSVIAVEERGFRSNGFSLIRAIFRRAFGDAWTATGSSADLVRFALQPSVIYTPLLLSLTGGVSGHAMEGLRTCVNITGGGLAGRLKFFRKVHHLGMDVSFSAFCPPDQMREVCALGKVALEEAYNTWNMGAGLIVVSSPTSADRIMQQANDHGLRSVVVGVVRPDDRLSMTLFDGSVISYP